MIAFISAESASPLHFKLFEKHFMIAYPECLIIQNSSPGANYFVRLPGGAQSKLPDVFPVPGFVEVGAEAEAVGVAHEPTINGRLDLDRAV